MWVARQSKDHLWIADWDMRLGWEVGGVNCALEYKLEHFRKKLKIKCN